MEAYEKNPEIIHEKFGERNESILHRAALNSRIEMVEFLLEHGAQQSEVSASCITMIIFEINLRHQDGNGNTPLHCAALGGDTAIAVKLIQVWAMISL